MNGCKKNNGISKGKGMKTMCASVKIYFFLWFVEICKNSTSACICRLRRRLRVVTRDVEKRKKKHFLFYFVAVEEVESDEQKNRFKIMTKNKSNLCS
jgi:hypothetical protein